MYCANFFILISLLQAHGSNITNTNNNTERKIKKAIYNKRKIQFRSNNKKLFYIVQRKLIIKSYAA